MAVLDLDSLASTTLQNEPWPFASLNSTICSARSRELENEFPTAGYHWFIQYLLAEAKGDKDSMAQHRIMTRTLVDLGADRVSLELGEFSSVWHELAEELFSTRYREVLSDLTSINVSKAPFRADFWRYHPSSFFTAHIDKPHKVVTHLIYLSGDWDARNGGQLQILDGNSGKVCAEVSPATGNGAILTYKANALHSVSRIEPQSHSERRAIQVWFCVA